jgi:integrase
MRALKTKNSEAEWPKKFDVDGHVFTIYHATSTRTNSEGEQATYDSYTLAYRIGGQRKRELSADPEALKARAKEIARDIGEGNTDSVSLRQHEREEYLHAKDILSRIGISLHTAATNYVEAVKLLGSDLVLEACKDYKRRNNRVEKKSVADAVKDMLDEKLQAKKSDRHRQTLKSHLERFKESVSMNMDAVTFKDLDAFLDSLTHGEQENPQAVSARTRDNYADSIVTLFEWAKRKRNVPADYDEHNRITRLHKDEDGAIEIFTPEEMAAMLAVADSRLVPFLAIGAFAGLRSSEVTRLQWSDVKLDNGSSCIVVQKGKVKKRGKSRRIVPMCDNLKAWLKPHLKKEGKVWSLHFTVLYDALRETAAKAQAKLREADPEAKLEWRSNALRHSFVTYRVAITKNVPQVALEAGNSPQMIDSNYRELAEEATAQKWFAILPPN